MALGMVAVPAYLLACGTIRLSLRERYFIGMVCVHVCVVAGKHSQPGACPTGR